ECKPEIQVAVVAENPVDPAVPEAQTVPEPQTVAQSVAEPPQAEKSIDTKPQPPSFLQAPVNRKPPAIVCHPPEDVLLAFESRKIPLTCPKCDRVEEHSVASIHDTKRIRCSCCGAKIKTGKLRDQLEDQEEHLRKLARR